MAFPYVFEEDFEQGTKGGFDTETDSAAQLDFAHYTELARYPWVGAAPYDGAYAMRVVLSGGTADAFVKEADIDIAGNAGSYFRFEVWFSPTFTATADDTFVLFEAQETGNAVQVAVGAKVTASTNALQIGIGLATPTSFGAAIERGVWYTIEVFADLDNAGSDDGTLDIWVTRDGSPVGAVYVTQLTALDQAVVTHGVLGCQDHLATTTGVILFGGLTQDDERLYPKTRYKKERLFTKSGHMFVGPGVISAAELLATAGASELVELWDTDRADKTPQQGQKAELKDSELSAIGQVSFVRGCYVFMSGTATRARIVTLGGDNRPGTVGPRAVTDNNVRSLGRTLRQA